MQEREREVKRKVNERGERKGEGNSVKKRGWGWGREGLRRKKGSSEGEVMLEGRERKSERRGM